VLAYVVMDEPIPPPEPPGSPADELPEHVIEHAPSGRSRCKGCRRTIDKGALRVGFVFEGPYGTGYLWHHLTCAARRRPDDLEAAYRDSAWENAKVPPKGIPDLEKLKRSMAESDEKRTKRPEVPFAEIDPSGRAKCKHCAKPLEKGAARVVLGRKVEFGNQTRVSPINVHVTCVAEALEADDCGTSPSGFAVTVRANSTNLSADQIEEILTTIGDLPDAEADADAPSDT